MIWINRASPYESLKIRTNTRPEQLDAGRAALASAERRIFGADGSKLLAGASLLGSSISADFRTKGGTSLVGQVIESAEDLAIVAQVLRDPRFETPNERSLAVGHWRDTAGQNKAIHHK